MNVTATGTAGRLEGRRPQALVHRWPTAAGIVFAVFVAAGGDAADIAPVVTASGFVYVAAAAVQRRAAAWPMFFATFVVIGIGTAVPGLAPAWASWWMLVIAAVLVAYGLIRGAIRPPWGVPLQTAAMVVLTAASIIAASADAMWAGLLVGAGLLAHAAWDVYHHRVARVVTRSMAEFCAVLDVIVAIVVLGATFVW
ncbi:hypothetical protein MOQ72_00880 [Saccharopolyspora sp. K220]|uniref:hypothetical protein n=1 Tax=Saccharopolyspora soli TaxID=2926618 RepID=UPI001F599A8C|nr:hypothetical protein [Saccharopolyspora soli]MCI2415964.1 hypothetical protein [Saccharopolyspora soli]